MRVDKNNLPPEIPVGSAEDLRNQTFGDLLVLYRINSKRQATWLCKCLLCDNYCTATSSNLKRGRCYNCGCKKKSVSSTFDDLTGKQFGRLTVVRRADDYISPMGQHLTAWWCSCSCSNPKLIYVIGNNLKKGLTLSCGCYHKDIIGPDLTGQILGNIKVIEFSHIDKFRNRVWRCQCLICGNEQFYATTSNLQNNNLQSCGCLQSVGEYNIKQLLNNANIPFISQKTFDDCRFPDTGALARFDFYILGYNNNPFICEFNGP